MGTCIFKTQCFECTKIPISWRKQLSMSLMLVNVSTAQHSPWRTNKNVFLEVSSRELYFWRAEKINSRCYWRWVLSNMPKRKCVYLSTIKTSSSTTLKSAKSALTCWLFLSKTKTKKYVFWCWCYTLFCKKDESLLPKRKTVSILKNFRRRSQSSTPETESKKAKRIPFVDNTLWIII